MAKNIEINISNGNNSYEVLYPKTTLDNVVGAQTAINNYGQWIKKKSLSLSDFEKEIIPPPDQMIFWYDLSRYYTNENEDVRIEIENLSGNLGGIYKSSTSYICIRYGDIISNKIWTVTNNTNNNITGQISISIYHQNLIALNLGKIVQNFVVSTSNMDEYTNYTFLSTKYSASDSKSDNILQLTQTNVVNNSYPRLYIELHVDFNGFINTPVITNMDINIYTRPAFLAHVS